MGSRSTIKSLLEKLTGQAAPIVASVPSHIEQLLGPSGDGLGYSQLNELLLTFGYDRVTPEFFQYLVDETTEYASDGAIRSLDELEAGVLRFRKVALLRYGNVKFAFKQLSSDPLELDAILEPMAPLEVADFSSRHQAIHEIDQISGAETYYLGYVVASELRDRLKGIPKTGPCWTKSDSDKP